MNHLSGSRIGAARAGFYCATVGGSGGIEERREIVTSQFCLGPGRLFFFFPGAGEMCFVR